ncbi:hypothetical protein [Eikenella corrodens]|uniref:hypothetical protein n=1 Tax=Eikenella corrodens TaxID=539 RepID=UPI00129B7794|nr:hypothetical protein [Eikenella corrodens]
MSTANTAITTNHHIRPNQAGCHKGSLPVFFSQKLRFNFVEAVLSGSLLFCIVI